jgi:hypothetical protein
MRTNQLVTFFRPEMSLAEEKAVDFSKSPAKPGLVMSEINRAGLSNNFQLDAYHWYTPTFWGLGNNGWLALSIRSGDLGHKSGRNCLY